MAEGALLKRARESAGLTQRDLAALAGTSQPAVARYESGRVSPRAATRDRLLAACGYQLVPTIERRTLGRGPIGSRLLAQRAEVKRAAARHGLNRVRVFGSVARGEDRTNSDLDLLVSLQAGRTLLDLAGAKEELEELLGVSVDIATQEMLKPHVRASALHDVVIL